MAKKIADEIRNERFEFAEPTETRLTIGRRRKQLFFYNLNDLIVLKALLAALSPIFSEKCSPHLYSFIKNRNTKQPIEKFRKFILQHKNHNCGKVDLWIYKTDIFHFNESIPVYSKSLIWSKLNELLLAASLGDDSSGYIKNLFLTATRPFFINREGFLQTNLIGIPYGSPLSVLLGNLYLCEFDFKISNTKYLFYARYGDDILVAHPNKEVLLETMCRIKEEVDKLKLSLVPIKEQLVYFTRAGRAPLNKPDDFRGCNKIHFLRFVIHANGNMHPTHSVVRRVLGSCFETINKIIALTAGMELEQRGKIICCSLKELLSPHDNYHLTQLLLRTNDHGFLAQLDLQIALWIAQGLTTIPHKKAFRYLPYHVMREQWQLPSLIQLRNNLCG